MTDINALATALREALGNALSEVSQNSSAQGVPQFLIPDRDYWVPIDQVHLFLGLGWNRDSIERRIADGELKKGVHWRDERPNNSRKALKKINVYQVNRWLSKR